MRHRRHRHCRYCGMRKARHRWDCSRPAYFRVRNFQKRALVPIIRQQQRHVTPGRTPLRVERNDAGGFDLVQHDFSDRGSLEKRRRVISTHATEKEAEQAAVAFADGPPKPPRKQESHRGKMAAKVLRNAVHSRLVGKSK
jgi:hypothetical protein